MRCVTQFQSLYGKKAAALYTQAGDYQKTARFYYKKAEDTYYQVLARQSTTACKGPRRPAARETRLEEGGARCAGRRGAGRGVKGDPVGASCFHRIQQLDPFCAHSASVEGQGVRIWAWVR